MTLAPDLTCRGALAMISAYLDGDLSATDCAAIERHCQRCRQCAGLLDGLRDTIGLCREAGDRALPEPIRTRAQARIRRLLEREKPPSGGQRN